MALFFGQGSNSSNCVGGFLSALPPGPNTTSIKLRIHPKELFGLLFIFHTLSFWMIDASVHGLIP